jgi:RNA polymerase sigma-70 factor (ECF subfamily)
MMNLDHLAVSAIRSQADLGQLYELLYPRLYNYVRYRCEDQATTEELVSQVFDQIAAALGKYDPERGPFEAWAFAIARNRVTSHHRTRVLRTFLPWEWFHQSVDPAPLPEETALLHEAEVSLLAALPRLKPKERDLLGLKYGSGLSNLQIATLTGLSEGNVAVILHRAIETLRQILNPASGGEGLSCHKETEHAKEG